MLGACHTRNFQAVASTFLRDLVLRDKDIEDKNIQENLIDLSNLLTSWDIILPQYDGTIPDGMFPSDRQGVPAGLLPFLLARFPILHHDHEDFEMHENAALMLHHFWECVDSLRAGGRSVLVSNVAPQDRKEFVSAADKFISLVVSKLYPDRQQVVEELRIKIPAAFELFEQGNEEGTNTFIRLKALFYGVHGKSVAVFEDGRLRLLTDLL